MEGPSGDYNDAQWTNIQDPVKHMFTGITKAIKVQSAGLKDLDKRTSKCISKDSAESLVADAFSSCFHQQDAAKLIQTVSKKADQEDVSGIEANLLQVSHQLGRLNEVLQTQNSAIRELNSKVTLLTEEMEDVRNPNFDQVFSYVDRQINTVMTDISEKLSVKAELKDMEKAAYKSIDSVYKSLNSQINSLQKDIGKAATKEDFHHLLSNKADGSDIRDMAADIKKCVTKQEMQHNIASQVRPLVTAVTSLEKVIQIQEDRTNRPQVPVYETPKHQIWTHDKITSLVEDVISQRYPSISDSVSSNCLDSSMSELREFLLREVGAHVESLRLEIGTTSREAAGGLRKHVEGRIQELAEGMRDARDTSTQAKNNVKELSNNVAKSLAKKAERSDVKKLLKDVEALGQSRSIHPSLFDSHAPRNSTVNSTLHQSHHENNRSLQEMDLLDPENSSAANAKRIRILSTEVDIIKSDLMKISSIHVDNSRDISDIRGDLENEVKQLRMKYAAERRGAHQQSDHHYDNPESYRLNASESVGNKKHGGAAAGSVPYADWKIALGELALNLRREMSDKPGREEMINMIAAELEPIDRKLQTNVSDVSTKASVEDISALDNALTDLRTKIAGELTGGRWLWTNGKIGRDGWVPWDTEVQNAAPAVLSWMKGSTSITARMPGLYRICGAVFTSLPSALQICLNGEPILSLQPNVSDPDTANNSQILREERYVIRRLRHSIGEVTCLTIDEYVSLPADAVLAMRFHSAATAQAFFSIKKM